MEKILSIIVVFYNGQREAKRTLFTLSSSYQDVKDSMYQVIVLDSGSDAPLDQAYVESFGPQFEYHFVETDHPSPTQALNKGLSLSKSSHTMVCIDGARMLSPGIVKKSIELIQFDNNALVYTVGFHLGNFHQNYSILQGYNQEVEDEMLDLIDWKKYGYQLFKVCSLEQDSYGMFSKVPESNCFTASTNTLKELGFNNNFKSIGGGLINLSVFKDLIEKKGLQPYCLIGEATFHQFHGGAASNISMEDHPVLEYKIEYHQNKGQHYTPAKYNPIYYGEFKNQLQDLRPKYHSSFILQTCNFLLKHKLNDQAIELMKTAVKAYPFNQGFLIKLHRLLLNQERIDEAENILQEALAINPQNPNLYVLRAKHYKNIDEWRRFEQDIRTALDKDPDNIDALLEQYKFIDKFNLDKKSLEQKIFSNKHSISTPGQLKKYVQILVKDEKLEEAYKLLNDYASIINLHYDLLLFKIRLLLKINKNLEASEVTDELYSHVIFDNSINEAPSKRLLGFLILQGKKEYARNYFLEFIKRFPEHESAKIIQTFKEPNAEEYFRIFKGFIQNLNEKNKLKLMSFIDYFQENNN